MSVTTTVRRMAASAIITGAMLASSAIVAHAQLTASPFIANGGIVSVRYISADATDNSELRYKVGPYDKVFDIIDDFTVLFKNNDAAYHFGQVITLPTTPAAGEEVVFMLYNISSSYQFYTGDLSRNFGGAYHVKLFDASYMDAPTQGKFTTKFGFEDSVADSGRDFDDLLFEVSNVSPNVVPEPSAVVLMAAGLMGLGVAARRRRKV